jgi:hypothetical protein
MKPNRAHIIILGLLAGSLLMATSCRKHLLDQLPTTELASSVFWKTPDDATTALMGAYAAVRGVFDRDYYFDGQGEYFRDRSGSNSTVKGSVIHGAAYNGANYNPSGYAGSFDNYFEYSYGAVNRCNYVIDNVEKMKQTLPNDSTALNAVIAEARLLRGMVYFRLISMWGDVPYIDHIVEDNSEVSDLTRMPIAQIKDSIYNDFTYAYQYLPVTPPAVGRAAQPAALAFRGKLELFWACWNHFGWPELDTFTPSASEADAAYKAAAADFLQVIDGFGLTLFRGGEPGNIDSLGKAEVLPNYYYLFTPVANGDPSILMSFTHGGTGTGQGEELMRDFSGRNFEGSQCWVTPRYEIADRYQSTITGDFCPPLIPMNPSSNPAARTTLNSAVNPNSYRDRDYRMKSTIVWDYEVMQGMISLKATNWVPFIYQTWNQNITIDGQPYTTYNTDGCNSGYVFRKFVRNYAGQGRSDGDYAWPVMRLADVYLMYAEASNAVSGPLPKAVDVVNQIRHTGNLPPLAASKTANADVFFQAIEQERIIELIAEGQRSFDIRRWRQLDDIWGPPGGDGKWRIDTHGANQQRYFQNTTERTYEQNYIFKIPQSEIDRNPKLVQNKPWR